MFERYTERARRVIFFARYEASQFGSMTIESEHLLLGLVREDKNITNRLPGPLSSIEGIRKEIEARTTIGEKTATSIDLPLSNECKRILAYANEEAHNLNHRHIGTEHLLLGILHEEKCVAAEILRERGLRLDAMREQLDADSGRISMEVRSGIGNSLDERLDAHGFHASGEHLEKVFQAQGAGELGIASMELRLFFNTLVEAIRERKPNVIAPIFPGFEWSSSLQGFESGLPQESDWHYRFSLTLLLAQMLLDRFER